MLLAFPVALLLSRFFGNAGTLLHMLLGVGCVIVASSLFDFSTTRWVSVVASLAMGALGAIFLLQGVSDLAPNATLGTIAYGVLGQTPERVLPDLFILWCLVTLVQHSRGRSRLFGICVMVLVLVVDVLDYGVSFRGGDIPEPAKLLYLLPFAWLLVESSRPRPVT